MWNASSSIVNTGPLEVLIIKLCHCNVLCFLVQHVPNSAIEVILVSNEADLRADSNDSSPMCISCKITKLFKLFLHRSEREHTIVTSLNVDLVVSCKFVVYENSQLSMYCE